MEERHDSSPMQAFDKDVLEMTVEDVYDISYVIGRDLLKVNTGSREFSDLQFKIVRVLEMFETMVNKYNLSLEELRMELENMKREMERVVAEGSSGNVDNVSEFVWSSVYVHHSWCSDCCSRWGPFKWIFPVQYKLSSVDSINSIMVIIYFF